MIMRKILILILMVISYSSFGQGNTTYQSATNTTVQFAGGLGATKRWSIPVYADTAAANSYYTTYPNFTKSGNVIYTSGNKYFWYNNGSMWLRLPDYATVQSLISSGNGLQWADTNILATKYYVSQNGGGSSIDTTALSNRIEQRIKYSDTGTSIIVTQAELNVLLSGKLNVSDTSSLLVTHSDLNSAIAGIVPIDTTALSNRINLKQNIADTAGWDATKSYVNTATAGKQNTTDTTSWDATKADLNSGLSTKENSFSKGSIIQGSGVSISGTLADRLVGVGDITISATGSAGFVQWGDTSGQLPTKFRIDTAKANIRAYIATKQDALGYTPEDVGNKVTDLSSPNDDTYPTTQAVVNALSSLSGADSTVFSTNFRRDTAALNIRNWTQTSFVDLTSTQTVGGAKTFTSPLTISSTTTPQRTVTNGSGSMTESVSGTGAVTFDAVGTNAGFTFSDRVSFNTSSSYVEGSANFNAISGVRGVSINAGSTLIAFFSDNLAGWTSYIDRNISFGQRSLATAKIHIAAPTATASTGQLKLSAGVAPTTPENGLLNHIGNGLITFDTSNSFRDTLLTYSRGRGLFALNSSLSNYLLQSDTATSKVVTEAELNTAIAGVSGGGGVGSTVDSLRIGGTIPTVGTIINHTFNTTSAPTGFQAGISLPVTWTTTGAVITGQSSWSYGTAGNSTQPINSAIAIMNHRIPYEDIEMEVDVVLNNVTNNTHIIFTKQVNGFLLGGARNPFTWDLTNGYASGRVLYGQSLTPTNMDSTARNPVQTGDTVTLRFVKSGFAVRAGLYNWRTKVTTQSYFNGNFNDAGGLWNLVFQNGGTGGYRLLKWSVSSNARKGGVLWVGDSQLSGSNVTSEARRYVNIVMRNNYKYFNVVGLPAISAHYFYTSGIDTQILKDIQPEGFVMALGNNDAFDMAGTITQFRDMVDSMMTRAQRQGAWVIAVGNTPRSNTTTDAHYDTVQALCARKGIPFVRSREALQDANGRIRYGLSWDGLHLNDSGSVLLANAITALAGNRISNIFARDSVSRLNIAGVPTGVNENVVEILARQRDGEVVAIPNPFSTYDLTYVRNQAFDSSTIPLSYFPFTTAQRGMLDMRGYIRTRDHISVMSHAGLQIGFTNGQPLLSPGVQDNIFIGNWRRQGGVSEGQDFPRVSSGAKRGIVLTVNKEVSPTLGANADRFTFINSDLGSFNGQDVVAINCAGCQNITTGSKLFIYGVVSGVTTAQRTFMFNTGASGGTNVSDAFLTGQFDQMNVGDPWQNGDWAAGQKNYWFGGRRVYGGGVTLNFAGINGTDANGANATIRASRGSGTGASGNIIFQTSVPLGASGNTPHSTFSTQMTITPSGVQFNNAITPHSMADASAPNNTIYYSTTANKLVYKDSGGVVNSLY